MTTNHTPTAPPGGGFFSRWSRRKDAQRQGAPVEEPAAKSLETTHSVPGRVVAVADEPLPHNAPTNATGEVQEPVRPLSLNDARALHAKSDFVPFMARGVSPEVRNAAMKQLFADPHYNVMDGLDIYIDDYTKTVPLPTAVIRRMAAAQFMGLFDDEPEREAEAADSSIGATAVAALPTELHAGVGGATFDATTPIDAIEPVQPPDETPAASRTETRSSS